MAKVRSEYAIGEFLYGIPSNEESAMYNPEGERVFIHTGYKSADGYGILEGWCDHEIKRASEHGNFQWGAKVRLATEEEKEHFMIKLMHQKRDIRHY